MTRAERIEWVVGWLRFYFFFTVPGLFTMFVLGCLVWVFAWWLFLPLLLIAFVRDWRERRRKAR